MLHKIYINFQPQNLLRDLRDLSQKEGKIVN